MNMVSTPLHFLKALYEIKISYLGFAEINETIDLNEDKQINYQLTESY